MIVRIIEIIIYAIITIGGEVLMWMLADTSGISWLLGVIGLMGSLLLIKTVRLTDAQIDNAYLKTMLTIEVKGADDEEV